MSTYYFSFQASSASHLILLMLEVNSFIIPVLQIRTLINRGDWTKITMAKNWCGLILKTVALSSEIIMG